MINKTLHRKVKINKGNSKLGVSPRLKIWPVTLTFDLWHWKSIGFQILLRTKYVPSLVKIHWRMLIIECSQGCYGRTDVRTDGRKDGRTDWRTDRRTEGRTDGRTDGSVTISLCNFFGEGIIKRPDIIN